MTDYLNRSEVIFSKGFPFLQVCQRVKDDPTCEVKLLPYQGQCFH